MEQIHQSSLFPVYISSENYKETFLDQPSCLEEAETN